MMTARPFTPEALAKVVARLTRTGATVQRVRISPEGEITIDLGAAPVQPADPFDLVDMRK